MADDQDDASKTEEPTAKKLSDARAKGDVPKSADISQLASLSGAFGVVVIAGGWLTRDLVSQLTPFIAAQTKNGYRRSLRGLLPHSQGLRSLFAPTFGPTRCA